MSEALFPPIDPFDTGMLDVGADHRLYYEQVGSPAGTPVVLLHGGPGSACNPGHRRFFDPAFYRVVLFDQRGGGRSEPLGEIASNTTQDLVADIERLRERLGIGRWLVFGGSWGATLALAYAQAHPACVTGLVLRGVFLGTARETEWYLCGLRRFLPESWAAFTAAAGTSDIQGLLDAYYRRLAKGDELEARAAARAWTAWESAVMALGEESSASAGTDETLLARARVQTHYLAHACFLAERPLLDGMALIEGIPGIIVQGRLDLVCPPESAQAVASRWPGAQLRMVENAGHLASNPRIAGALVTALADFKERLAVQA